MNRFKIFVVTVLGLLAVVSIAGAQGQPARGRGQQPPRFKEVIVVTAAPQPKGGSPSDYFMTFSGPVGVPGVSLPAGTYLFQFPSENGKSVIQVLKADHSNVYAMFLTIPITRSQRGLSSDAHEVTWLEGRPEGAPPAIAAWYLPGKMDGFKFVYPK